jgi:hypothetical protein
MLARVGLTVTAGLHSVFLASMGMDGMASDAEEEVTRSCEEASGTESTGSLVT